MSNRPPTVAGLLEHVAEYLDRTDPLINTYAVERGMTPPCTGDSVQRDLRMLAMYLHEHPTTDAAMYDRLPDETAV